MNEERKLAHVERIAIRWGDMDAMGHVNNTVYFRYMEQARMGWLPTAPRRWFSSTCAARSRSEFPRRYEVY